MAARRRLLAGASGTYRLLHTQGTTSSSSTTSSTTTTFSPSPTKPFYVTTPIFYVNAAPHIGHLHSMVLADVIKRWHLLQGRRAVLSTGTDEHGLKVQQAAQNAQMPPQEFCDSNSRRFRDLARAASVEHDFYARTTDETHKEAVKLFWKKLSDNGFVYAAPREGWYSVSDECFYKEDEVERKVHDTTGRLMQVASATGNEVAWTEEENYHFRLTSFRDQLLDLYGSGRTPPWIRPATRLNEVVSWVRTSLSDLSISRPSSRLQWGIPVPGDPSQTIYVWVDALVNYIVQAGYATRWLEDSPVDAQAPWPADVHLIGKDILRFHCVYWPALLLAVGLPPPRSVLAHAHWTMSHRKMSKSQGNVVEPFAALQRWGVDPLRFFLMREGGQMANDKAYSNDRIVARYKKDLASLLGNSFNRILSASASASGSIKACIDAMLSSSGWHPVSADAEASPKLHRLLLAIPEGVQARMDDYDVTGALDLVFEALAEVGVYLDQTKPWDLAQHAGDGTNALAFAQSVFYSAETIRIAAIALQPVMPERMGDLLDRLGVDASRRGWESARLGGDPDYGVAPKDVDGSAFLFPKLVTEK